MPIAGVFALRGQRQLIFHRPPNASGHRFSLTRDISLQTLRHVSGAYLGIPSGTQVSPFTIDLYERATQPPVHRNTWEFFKPHIIAHDVGRTKDRSTAVIGGKSPFAPDLIGIKEFEELQQGLYGSARADTLAMVIRK